MVNLSQIPTGDNLKNGLFYPISNRIIGKIKERNDNLGRAVASTMSLNVKSIIRSVCVAILSFFRLALINSLTFAIGCSLLMIKHQLMMIMTIKPSSSTGSTFSFQKFLFSEIMSNLNSAVKSFSISNMKAASARYRFLMEA